MMTYDLEVAIKHIKARADAWAVKEITDALQSISKRIEPNVQPMWIENSKGERIAFDKVGADKAVKILEILRV